MSLKRAPRVCAQPGCPNIAATGLSYCKQCETARVKRYNEARPPGTYAPYNKQWKKLRSKYLADHPTCEYCGRKASDVHHEIPVRDGGTNDFSNLVALCRSCHSRVTAQRDGGFGNPKR